MYSHISFAKTFVSYLTTSFVGRILLASFSSQIYIYNDGYGNYSSLFTYTKNKNKNIWSKKIRLGIEIIYI